MTKRDLAAEFETLRRRVEKVRRGDDNGPILTIESVSILSESPDVIVGRVEYVDERTTGRPLRTSDFDYETQNFAVEGPEDAADLLLVNLEEEVLAVD